MKRSAVAVGSSEPCRYVFAWLESALRLPPLVAPRGLIPWQEIAKVVKGALQGAEGCVLNFIGFKMKPGDRREMESIVCATQGKIREIE